MTQNVQRSRRDHRLITHRIIEVIEPGAHPVVPYVGHATAALAKPGVRQTLAVTGAALLAAVLLAGIWHPTSGPRRREGGLDALAS